MQHFLVHLDLLGKVERRAVAHHVASTQQLDLVGNLARDSKRQEALGQFGIWIAEQGDTRERLVDVVFESLERNTASQVDRT